MSRTNQIQAAFGYRYRLRGPSSSVPQARQFLELTWIKTSGFVPNTGEEAAAAALMEKAPVSVEPVTLTILPGELYSEPHDVVSQGPAQLATILGDEFDAMAAKNFAKVADEFILVKLPDGTVDDFFEGFLQGDGRQPQPHEARG